MVHVAEQMTQRNMSTPLLIGGATTSPLHTALKIAPAYRASSTFETPRAPSQPQARCSTTAPPILRPSPKTMPSIAGGMPTTRTGRS